MTEPLAVVGVRTPIRDLEAILVDVRDFARSRGGWAALLDAERVVGRDHALSAVAHARRAFDRGTNAAGSLDLEVLLYVSGERQISRAIEAAGVKAGRPFALVLGGIEPDEVLAKFSWQRDDRVLEPTIRKLRALGFSRAEIASAGERALDLALERVARVDLIK